MWRSAHTDQGPDAISPDQQLLAESIIHTGRGLLGFMRSQLRKDVRKSMLTHLYSISYTCIDFKI